MGVVGLDLDNIGVFWVLGGPGAGGAGAGTAGVRAAGFGVTGAAGVAGAGVAEARFWPRACVEARAAAKAGLCGKDGFWSISLGLVSSCDWEGGRTVVEALRARVPCKLLSLSEGLGFSKSEISSSSGDITWGESLSMDQ